MDCPKRDSLAGLPDEAMLEILARASFRSVCRSKCVAKAWRDLIDDPLNRGRLPQTLQGFFAISDTTCDSDDSSGDGSSDLEHFFIKYLGTPVPLDIDPCLSFLTSLPETETAFFEDSCNGLLLFEHCTKSSPYDALSYIVCNPATKHWATVPVCARCPPVGDHSVTATYLIFDPARAISPHFHLIQFWKLGWGEESSLTYEEVTMMELSVHTYSSESGVWSHIQTDWNEQGHLEGWRREGSLKYKCNQRTFVNGILHLLVSGLDRYQIVAVDVQGKTKRIITTPDAAEGDVADGMEWLWPYTPCIGQSQGRLHYINYSLDNSRLVQSSKLSIWELQDYDTQDWVLKDTVKLRTLFGRMIQRWEFVSIHPDRNVAFFLDDTLNRLISYDMDRKEVSVVSRLSEHLEGDIVPYIPCFSESPALTNKN